MIFSEQHLKPIADRKGLTEFFLCQVMPTQQTRHIDPMLAHCLRRGANIGSMCLCLLGREYLTLSSLTLHCHLHPLQAANC